MAEVRSTSAPVGRVPEAHPSAGRGPTRSGFARPLAEQPRPSQSRLPKRGRARARGLALACLAVSLPLTTLPGPFAGPQPALAQDALPVGGGVMTRFSGTTGETLADGSRRPVIDPGGPVALGLDLSEPGRTADGSPWRTPPEVFRVTAGEIGQVFGLALDDGDDPAVYLSATSAFGLHRNADRTDWMPGQWGAEGGPGTIYRLDPTTGYTPGVFAQVTLEGRANTGAALGNLAYDPWNRQIFVSDLETGMIHRLRQRDGLDLGHFDHGVTGRSDFLDVAADTRVSLPAVAFDPTTRARLDDCPSGDIARDPACWNVADFRRRVWGLAVRRAESTGEVRLYYATWGSQAFGNPDHAGAGDDARNAVWSVRLGPDGAFDAASVRREVLLPDVFRTPEDIARAGRSHPVADIAFPAYGPQDVMLLAERGGLRNRGLDADGAFAFAGESRVLRYRLGEDGVWRPDGRYDVGYGDRRTDGPPYLRANAAGGVAFGMGYDDTGTLDTSQPDRMVWMSGDTLCDAAAPCPGPDGAQALSGLQATPSEAIGETLPDAAFRPYPVPGPATAPQGPDASYMVEAQPPADIAPGSDATRIGDIELRQQVPVATARPADGGPWYGPWPGSWPWPAPRPGPDGFRPPPPGADALPELAVTKVTPPVCDWERECVFLISVTNNGPGVYTGPILLADFAEVGDLTGASPGWTCDQAFAPGPVYCWGDPFALEPGESAFLQLGFNMPIPGGPPPPVDDRVATNCAFVGWTGAFEGEDRVFAVETALTLRGYPAGPIDGLVDPALMAAVAAYRADAGLPPGGIDDALYASLYPGSAGLAGDANPDNDIACDTFILPGEDGVPPIDPLEQVDLAINKRLLAGPCRAGEACYFQLEVRNVGGEPLNAPISIADVAGIPGVGPLPPAAIQPSSAGLVCTPFGGGKRCHIDGLPVYAFGPGSALGWPIRIELPADPGGPDLRNCVILDWALMGVPPDGNPANDYLCIDVPIEDAVAEDDDGPGEAELIAFDLAVEKTGPETCMRGVGCPYTITVTNTGPANYIGPVWLNDQWEDGPIGDLGIAGGDWACTTNYRGVGCRHDAVTLAAGDTLTMDVMWPVPADRPLGPTENCAYSPFPMAYPEGSWDRASMIERALAFEGFPPGPVNGTIDAETDAAIAAFRADRGLPPGMMIDDDLLEALFPDSSGVTRDTDRDNNQACTVVEIVEAGPVDWGPGVDLAPHGDTVCRRGESCTLDVRIDNLGEEPFVGAAGLRGTLDPAVTVESLTAQTPGLICAATGPGAYECLGARLSIKPGDAARFQVVIAIPSDFAAGEITHTKDMVWPDATAKDRNPENDRHVSIITIEDRPEPETPPAPDLSVAKVATQGVCTAGDPCRFAVTVTNAGPGAFAGSLVLEDRFDPTSARLIGSSPDWACRGTRGGTTCTLAGVTLAAGDSRALALTVRPSRNSRGTLQNCAALSWGGANRVRDVQQALNDAGFAAGPADGIAGRRTRAAIRAYQQDAGLPVSGEIDAALVARLLGSAAQGDGNPANDRACVSVQLIAPEPAETSPQPEPPSQPTPPATPPPSAQPPATQPPAVQPPTAVPGPVCPKGWRRVGPAQAAIFAAQGRRVRTVSRGGRTILCVAPPRRTPPSQTTPNVTPTPGQQSSAPRCKPGWRQVSRAQAKTLVNQGYQITQVGSGGRSILCARRR